MQARPHFLPYIFLISCLFAQTSSAQKVSRSLESFLAGRTDSVFYLNARFIDPSSATIEVLNKRQLHQGTEFVLERRTGIVTIFPSRLHDVLPDSGWTNITVSYAPAPFILQDSYRLPAAIALETPSATVAAPSLVPQKPAPSSDWFGTGLQRSGSIMRGMTIGSNRDASLTSGFRLQLAGPLAEDVNVVAALTDENSPIQPEGTTQSLREVDQVSIDITGRSYAVTMGDFVYSKDRSEGGMFGVIERKLQGARVTVKPDGLPARSWNTQAGLVGASSGGRFHINKFQGSDGNQGPFRLIGKYGESRIVIIAGSERVTINGERMVRGEVQDYVIDYGSGEVQFTSRRLITSASRIVVDFEYADRQYARNVTGASVATSSPDGRISVRASALQESDDADSPLDGSLDAISRDILRRSGADRFTASMSGIRFAGTDSVTGGGLGQYLLVDTTVSGKNLTILRFAPGDSLALYTVTFSPVDVMPADSAGYLRVQSGEFRFEGLGKGKYLPIQFIPLPQMQRFFNTQIGINVLKGLTVGADVAGSLNDRNRLSSLDDAGARGSASAVTISFQDPSLVIGGTSFGALRASYLQRSIDAAFISPNRVDGAEFERTWDLPGERTTAEVMRFAQLSFSPVRLLSASASLGTLEREENSSSEKSAVDITVDDSSSVRVTGGLEHVRRSLHSVDLRSDWLRRNGDASVSLGWSRIGGTIAQEERRERLGSSQTLTEGSFRYLDIAPRIGSATEGPVNWSAEVQWRSQDSAVTGQLQNSFTSITQLYEGQFRSSEAFSTNLALNLRSSEFTPLFKARGNSDQITTLVRSQTRLTMGRRALEADIFYEYSNQRSSRFERVYVRVVQGTGNYTFLGDTNGNGIADENEFIPVRYDGDFVVLIVPGESLVPVNDVKSSIRLRLQPSRFDLPAWMKVLSSETYVRVEERSSDPDPSNVYALRLSKFLKHSTTLSGSQIATQDLHFNEFDPNFSIRLRLQEKRGLTQFIAAPERMYGNERSLRIRTKLGSEIANQTDAGIRRDRLLANGQSPRERDLFLQSFHSDFTYRIERQWEAGGTVGVAKSENFIPTSPMVADMNEQSMRVIFGVPGSGQLRTELRREEVIMGRGLTTGFSGLPPFEMTDGKAPGTSWLWQLSGDLRVTDLIQVSVSYFGRKEGGRNSVHTARVEARAMF